MTVRRRYEPYDKHKRPKGFGALCPEGLPIELAQKLLEKAISVGQAGRNKLWVAQGRWCFCFHPTRIEEQVWHGFPVIGGEVPEVVLKALEEQGLLTRQQRRELRRQRELPEAWP